MRSRSHSARNSYTAPRDLTEPSRFKNPLAWIRSFHILIPQFLRGDFFDSIDPLADIRAPWRQGGSLLSNSCSVQLRRSNHQYLSCGVALDHCVGIAKDHLKPHDEARAAPGIRLINQAVASEQASWYSFDALRDTVDYRISLTGVTTWIVGRILRRGCDGDLLDR
jgi:hypothetical protein